MTKVGIYISGLGESFHQESIQKYATCLKNEMEFNTHNTKFELRTEKVNYSNEKTSTVISIIETKNKEKNVVYKLYEFDYNGLLTEKFNKKNILLKNLSLFLLVIRKIPLLIKRLFSYDSYSRTGQIFYVFGIFLIISLSILFLIPSMIVFVNDYSINSKMTTYFQSPLLIKFLSFLGDVSRIIVPVTAFLLVLLPDSKTFVTTLASEFACADNYIQFGEQSQIVLGNLDLLIEYISENEENSKIHIHSYSFGTVLALDLLFPIGNIPSKNSKQLIELIVTIGTPYEFIKAYYPNFYNNRCLEIQNNLKWLNVYSISDALATNFREDDKIGESEFGVKESSLKPININYEIAPIQRFSFINFFTLLNLKVHKQYWDESTQGQSCMRMIYNKMKSLDLIN